MAKISQLIKSPAYWAKNCLGMSADGIPIYNFDVYWKDNEEIDPSKKCKSFSLIGAVVMCYSAGGRDQVIDRLSRAVMKHTGHKYWVQEFNNHPDTKWSDIEKVLKLADL